MSELQRTYNHDSYLITRQIIDHDVFVNMSTDKSRVQAITDVLDHYCNITDKYDKMTPTQKYAFLDEIGAQIDLAIDDARLDIGIGYIISKENNNEQRNDEEGTADRPGNECDREGEGSALSGDGDDQGETGGAEGDFTEDNGICEDDYEAD